MNAVLWCIVDKSGSPVLGSFALTEERAWEVFIRGMPEELKPLGYRAIKVKVEEIR